MPVVPSTPRFAVSSSSSTTLSTSLAETVAYVCQRKPPITLSPIAKPGALEAMTSPMPEPRMTSPIWVGAT